MHPLQTKLRKLMIIPRKSSVNVERYDILRCWLRQNPQVIKNLEHGITFSRTKKTAFIARVKYSRSATGVNAAPFEGRNKTAFNSSWQSFFYLITLYSTTAACLNFRDQRHAAEKTVTPPPPKNYCRRAAVCYFVAGANLSNAVVCSWKKHELVSRKLYFVTETSR